MPRAFLFVVTLVAAPATGRAVEPSAPPATPDAEILLNLDLLKDADLTRDHDLLGQLGLLERLRLLDRWQLLDSAAPLAPSGREVR